MIKIAIDGPSGAGKSSVARAVAKKNGIVYVDTGAMYRTVGLFVKMNGADPKNSDAVSALLPKISLEIRFENGEQHIYLCGKDVGDSIRTPEMSMYASAVSAVPDVRAFLLDTQRNIAKTNNVIMDGRDIGTVIFPDADVKIFLTASSEARAMRRYRELEQKGITTTYEEVLSDMLQRDKNDAEREIAPAVAAEDAVIFDNSELDFDESVTRLTEIIEEKLAEKGLSIVSSATVADTDKANDSSQIVQSGIDEKQNSPSSETELKSDGTHEDTVISTGGSAKKAKKHKKNKFYAVMYALLARLLRFTMRIHAHGTENIPDDGGIVICSNHISMWDVITIGAVTKRQVRFLAKAELSKIPVVSSFFRAMGACFIDRNGSDVDAIKKCIAMAKDGDAVGIFPQGTRRTGKNPIKTPIKNGAVMVAYRAGVPIVPACIVTKNMKYKFLRRKDIYFGSPFTLEDLGLRNGGRYEYTNAMNTVFCEICDLGSFTPETDISKIGKKSKDTDGIE